MKAHYRGYEITVTKERCLGGWIQIFYSVFRESDLRECTSGFSEGDDTVRDFMGYMKERIDSELEEDDPWGEKKEMKV